MYFLNDLRNWAAIMPSTTRWSDERLQTAGWWRGQPPPRLARAGRRGKAGRGGRRRTRRP